MASSSSSDRWRRLEALFYEALELKPEARAEFLDRRCGGDMELRNEVERLLESAEKPTDFLARPVLEAADQMVDARSSRQYCSRHSVGALRNCFHARSWRNG